MDTPKHPDGAERGDPPARLAMSRRSYLHRSAALAMIALGAMLGGAACRELAAAAPNQTLDSVPPTQAVPSPTTVSSVPTSGLPGRAGVELASGPAPTLTPIASPTLVSASSPTVVPAPSPTSVPAPAATATPGTSPAKQPNVLLVTIDTLRADRIGAYGFALANTPILDQFAREGVRFDRAMCQLPQTDPAHAALMTGLYASTNGLKVHMKDTLSQGAQTIATIFRAAGYQTAGFYSWPSLDPQYCGLDQGFQTYEGNVFNVASSSLSPSGPRPAGYQDLKSEVSIVKTADLSLSAYPDYDQDFDGRSDVTNQAVFAWLDAHVGQGPFFLWVHYFDAHFPYTPAAGYDHLWALDYQGNIDGAYATIWQIFQGKLHPAPADIARIEELYQGEVAFVDAQLGHLLDHLAQLGIKDDTIITVTGDHGESFGEHGDWIHGLKVFETEVRVPLLMRYPGRLPAGTTVTAPAQHIDVLPTLLDLTGLAAKQSIQGTSLLPVISQDTQGVSRVAFTELANEAFVSMLTWGDWKLIRNDANDQLQLYNLNLDEGEQQNLASDQMRITAALHTQLLALMKLSGVSH